MSEREIQKQDERPAKSDSEILSFPLPSKGDFQNNLRQHKDNQKSDSVSALGFSDKITIKNEKTEQQRKEEWDKAMAAEIKDILSRLDKDIEQAIEGGNKEALILKIGSDQVRIGTPGVPPRIEPVKLNDRHKAVLEALKKQPGIEAEIKKDPNNVYWIVARHKD